MKVVKGVSAFSIQVNSVNSNRKGVDKVNLQNCTISYKLTVPIVVEELVNVDTTSILKLLERLKSST